jgi:signal transduction histidine kinase
MAGWTKLHDVLAHKKPILMFFARAALASAARQGSKPVVAGSTRDESGLFAPNDPAAFLRNGSAARNLGRVNENAEGNENEFCNETLDPVLGSAPEKLENVPFTQFALAHSLGQGRNLFEYVAKSGSSEGNAVALGGISLCVAIACAVIAAFLRGALSLRRGKSDGLSFQDESEASLRILLESAQKELELVKEEKRQLEIKALESRINPHFLYNTFGALRWKALEEGSKELCDAIDCMTRFCRLSLGKGKGYITVEQEKELIEAYIAVQRLSFGNRATCELEVDESAKQVEIPKMILQPLVENAFIHSGIAKDGKRVIKISIKKVGKTLRLEVCDNGCGMDHKTLGKVNRNSRFSEERGVGVAFVRSSLQLHYGGRARVWLKSAPGKGTTARVDIPVSPETCGLAAWDKRQSCASSIGACPSLKSAE